jgi:hypothetical protein
VPEDLMTRCEQRKEYKVDGRYELRWKEVAVSEALGAQPADVRCMHCHGSVRIHKQQVGHGPRDHVEHRFGKTQNHVEAVFTFRVNIASRHSRWINAAWRALRLSATCAPHLRPARSVRQPNQVTRPPGVLATPFGAGRFAEVVTVLVKPHHGPECDLDPVVRIVSAQWEDMPLKRPHNSNSRSAYEIKLETPSGGRVG